VGEVVSKRNRVRDYEKKRQEYYLYGITEYWIVDPFLRQVTVLPPGNEDWIEVVVRDDQATPTQLLPGLSCRGAELWMGVTVDDIPE
jgi:Uma2 family endonuclease